MTVLQAIQTRAISSAGPLCSIAFAMIAMAALLQLSGHDPLRVYGEMLSSAFSDRFAISETLVAATPIMLCALSVAVGQRVGLMNLGVEGQLLAGATGSTFVAVSLPETTPAPVMLTLMGLTGIACGAAWGVVPAALKVLLNVNEAITGLLLNYVIALFIEFLIHGPWCDPGTASWPQTQAFPSCAELPHLAGCRVHLGLPIAVAIAVALAIILHRTRVGFKAGVIGGNPAAARYAHYPVKRYLIMAMVLSGAIASLAGFSQVAAIEGRLRSGISPGFGYTGFLVCFLARGNPLAIVVTSVLLGGFLSGADSLQLSEKLPFATVNILQGAMFLFLIASERFTKQLSERTQLAMVKSPRIESAAVATEINQ